MGFSNAYRRLIPTELLGAFVTSPVTARPRRGAVPPRALNTPGGLLMHTGLDNPGVEAVIRRHRKRWENCPVPVIGHVAGVNVGEAVTCVEHLSLAEVVAGIELGLPDSLTIETAMEIVTVARQVGTLPLIVRLPLWRAPDLAVRIVESDSADALTVAAPPRGTVWHHGRAITGRLYGPATFPQSLWMLRQVAGLVGNVVPLIGCGGVHCARDALAMLDAGAVAVQVDSYVWKDPAGFAQLARDAASWSEEADESRS